MRDERPLSHVSAPVLALLAAGLAMQIGLHAATPHARAKGADLMPPPAKLLMERLCVINRRLHALKLIPDVRSRHHAFEFFPGGGVFSRITGETQILFITFKTIARAQHALNGQFTFSEHITHNMCVFRLVTHTRHQAKNFFIPVIQPP